MSRQDNLLLIWDRMGDYHRARWRAVQHHFADRVVYAADFGATDSLYGWENTIEANHIVMSDRPPEKFDIRRLLRFYKIITDKSIGTVCIPGYGRIEYVLFLILSRIIRKRVILFAESWYPASRPVELIKSLFLRAMVDGFLVSGERAEYHFANRLKISPERIRKAYSVVDNDHFAKNEDNTVVAKRLLCVARFSPEKNLELLIETFLSSELKKAGWELLLVGGGPLKSALQTRYDAENQVVLMAWQKYADLPALYQNAKIFILPSIFEPWGLVVNEAMAGRLPVILSREVGCLPDLLQEGKNGWSFDPNVSAGLLEILNRISHLTDRELDIMGNKSAAIISGFTVREFAMHLDQLIRQKK